MRATVWTSHTILDITTIYCMGKRLPFRAKSRLIYIASRHAHEAHLSELQSLHPNVVVYTLISALPVKLCLTSNISPSLSVMISDVPVPTLSHKKSTIPKAGSHM